MSTPNTSVDVQGMTLAQQDFQSALDVVNTIYSSMSEERDTLAASWTGEAASAFGQALQNWLDDIYGVQQELILITETLATHTGIYADTNEGSQEMVQEFQSGLSGLENAPHMFYALREQAAPGLLPDRVEAVRDTNAAPGSDPTSDPGAPPPAQDMPAQYRQMDPMMPLQPEQGREVSYPADRVPADPGQPGIPLEQGRSVEAPLLPTESTPVQPAMFRQAIPAIPAQPALPAQPRYVEAQWQPAEPAQPGVPPQPLLPRTYYDGVPQTPVLPDAEPGQD